jgi:hypothetical protein
MSELVMQRDERIVASLAASVVGGGHAHAGIVLRPARWGQVLASELIPNDAFGYRLRASVRNIEKYGLSLGLKAGKPAARAP